MCFSHLGHVHIAYASFFYKVHQISSVTVSRSEILTYFYTITIHKGQMHHYIFLISINISNFNTVQQSYGSQQSQVPQSG